MIDEGQDFSVQMLRSLVSAVDPEGSFTLFGDAAQQIYGRGVSWRSAGIEVSKVWEFAHNYRNSAPIVRLAQAIAAMPYYRDVEDLVEPDEDVDEGPPPTMRVFQNPSGERDWVIAQAQAQAARARSACSSAAASMPGASSKPAEAPNGSIATPRCGTPSRGSGARL